MPRFPMTYLTVLSIGLVIVAFSGIPAQAQIYPQGIVSSPGRATMSDTLAQQSAAGTGFESTLDFLKRKDEERERREIRDRQRRILDNFTRVPESLRDSYFKRADAPYSGR